MSKIYRVSEKDLKPCPFCGGVAKVADETQWIGSINYGGRSKYIYCVRCNNRTTSYFWDDAKMMVEAWNRRPT